MCSRSRLKGFIVLTRYIYEKFTLKAQCVYAGVSSSTLLRWKLSTFAVYQTTLFVFPVTKKLF